jgi:hypothetical protein
MKSKLLHTTLSLLVVSNLGLSAALAAEKTQEQLKAGAKVTEKDATATALAKVPEGKVKSSELEEEHGKLVYSFDISKPDSKNITEVQVDAKTGKVVSTQVETPEDQAKENAADRKEKK